MGSGNGSIDFPCNVSKSSKTIMHGTKGQIFCFYSPISWLPRKKKKQCHYSLFFPDLALENADDGLKLF